MDKADIIYLIVEIITALAVIGFIGRFSSHSSLTNYLLGGKVVY